MAHDDTTVGRTPFWKLFVAVWLAIGGALMMLLMIIGGVLLVVHGEL